MHEVNLGVRRDHDASRVEPGEGSLARSGPPDRKELPERCSKGFADAIGNSLLYR